MIRRLMGYAAVALTLTLPLAACDDGDDLTGPGSNRPNGFTLLLTDAPGDFKAAVVTISQIYMQSDDGGQGRVVLRDQPITTNLLALQANVLKLVETDIAAGSYNQLRLVIAGGYVEVESANGSTSIFASSPTYSGLPAGAKVAGTLQMPSFAQSGLKINLPGGNLKIGEGEKIVLIDFQVKESFGHEAGNSGKWVMHPVIKATDVTFAGNVTATLALGAGVTLPSVGGTALTVGSFKAKLTPSGGGTATEVAFTDGDNNGTFEAMFKGLVPGTYSLNIVVPAGITATLSPVAPVNVTVVSKQTTTQAFTITAAALDASITATLKLGAGVTLPSVGGTQVTLGGFKAKLTPTGGTATEVVFTDANNDGTFEAKFTPLVAGTYSLDIVKPTGVNATFTPAPPQNVTLTAGQQNTTAFTVTAASAS